MNTEEKLKPKFTLKMILPHTVYFRKEDLTRKEVIEEINKIIKEEYGLGFVFTEIECNNIIMKKQCKLQFWNMKQIEIYTDVE